MSSYIVYMDESGDEGIDGSRQFILTSLYMSFDSWQNNYNLMKELRQDFRKVYGFHVKEEMHTRDFLYNKNPYKKYNWSECQRQEMIKSYAKAISTMDVKIVNVIIDKTKIIDPNYKVLENALKYSIQRIENDSSNNWKYMIITDKGRIGPMKKTAREIRVFNPIRSKYDNSYYHRPIENFVEDILEKDSRESYFIQVCDFVSYFVNLYYKTKCKGERIPNRMTDLIDETFVRRVMATIKERINLAASDHSYGLVIYPK